MNEILIHKCFIHNNAMQVKEAINIIWQKDSLDDNDIQAVKILTDVFQKLWNPVFENQKMFPLLYGISDDINQENH